MFPRSAGPSLWAAEGGPGSCATGGWVVGAMVQAGGRAGEASLLSLTSRRPQVPAGARLAAKASCARGALWCPGAVTAGVLEPLALPDHRE